MNTTPDPVGTKEMANAEVNLLADLSQLRQSMQKLVMHYGELPANNALPDVERKERLDAISKTLLEIDKICTLSQTALQSLRNRRSALLQKNPSSDYLPAVYTQEGEWSFPTPTNLPNVPRNPAPVKRDKASTIHIAASVQFYEPHSANGHFSNLYPSPFDLEGEHWPTVEHFYHAMKTFSPEDRAAIRSARTPEEAKALGRWVRLRADWEQIKETLMFQGLLTKFSLPEFQEVLLGTENRTLLFMAPNDYYWGCGALGTGQNRLGVLLGRVREQIRNEKK